MPSRRVGARGRHAPLPRPVLARPWGGGRPHCGGRSPRGSRRGAWPWCAAVHGPRPQPLTQAQHTRASGAQGPTGPPSARPRRPGRPPRPRARPTSCGAGGSAPGPRPPALLSLSRRRESRRVCGFRGRGRHRRGHRLRGGASAGVPGLRGGVRCAREAAGPDGAVPDGAALDRGAGPRRERRGCEEV